MIPAPTAPTCRIIAGPNGAGKTTFALKYLPQVAPRSAFVNADLIAGGLSPLAPEQGLLAASRLFLQQIEEHIAASREFAFETTLSGRSYVRLIRRLRSTRWRIELLYLALPRVEVSRLRVAERVAHGGHSVAEADIVRRFPRSLRNLLDVFAAEVHHTQCFLNSGPVPEIVFVQHGSERSIINQLAYDQLVKEASR
jgi:predicted ABC-type ATPase